MYDAVSEVKTYDLEEIYVTGNAFEDNKKIGKRLLFGLAIGAIPTECGWAISESLMVPFMLSLDVPHSFVALHWLPAPLIGFFTHRFFGRWSDNCGSHEGSDQMDAFLFLFHSPFSAFLVCAWCHIREELRTQCFPMVVREPTLQWRYFSSP